MGNTVVWKPASSAMLSAYYVMRLLEEAGMPPGVINFLPGERRADHQYAARLADLAACTSRAARKCSTAMWKKIGENISRYRGYPRIVGETGGKDFIVAHPSADPAEVAVAIVRGGFEYQGQKCSAASRIYVPASLWPRCATARSP
jgi:1-pyrroline-5-carboxylate dehydrogenase